VQTDPNFANYLYSAEKACVQLLDFGATREYGVESRSALRNMLDACIANDAVRLEQAAVEVGYIEDGDPVSYRHSVVQLLRTATEPVRAQGAYDFSDSDLAARMRDTLVQLRIRDKFGRLPPTEILFLHRKLGGLYLLLTRLRATVETSSIARSCLS
jgi:predicted unusual protein kinase regulating ubiquinone biosynthesis (AarF/ABC1/UbiB family)